MLFGSSYPGIIIAVINAQPMFSDFQICCIYKGDVVSRKSTMRNGIGRVGIMEC